MPKMKNMNRPQQQAAGAAMKHKEYTLYTKNVTLNGGRKQDIYYFCKGKPKSGTPSAKPSGYSVGENARTGLPYLKKDR